MNFEVIAQARAEQGSGASRRLRNAGRVPAIVYGAGKDAQAVTLDHNSIYHALRVEAFHASVLSLNIDGQVEKVLLRDVQHHPFRQLVLHVDFQRVDPNAKLHIKVPLHFVNADIAPGVKLGGGMVSHTMNDIEVTCLPQDLPAFIEVDLQNLQAGHSIHASELAFPPGVSPVLHGEDYVVVSIPARKGAGESDEAEGGAAAA